MVYSYDRRIAKEFRHKQRGIAKLRSQRYYRKHRQKIRQRGKQWRRKNKSRIKRYEKRRKAQPSLYRLRNAHVASQLIDHTLFDPEKDISLLEYDVSFADPETEDIGFVDWIDLDTGEVHALFVRDNGERFNKTYDLYEWLDEVDLMYEDGEEAVLQVLDALHTMAEEESEDDEEDE
jgi:hypothetical protein